MNSTQKRHKQAILATNNIVKVNQVGAKSLYEAHTTSGGLILYSYTTPVAVYIVSQWVATEEKFSKTTSKQVTQHCKNCKRVSSDVFQALLETALY